jgi:CheY-like chemotaxis protein
VLVVEDDDTAASILTRHLARAGYRTEVAYDGLEALEKARRLRPAAITLDILLPKSDGWEVLRALKGDPRSCDIPIVVVSVVDHWGHAQTLGADDYLVKPVEREVLLACLARHVSAVEAEP